MLILAELVLSWLQEEQEKWLEIFLPQGAEIRIFNMSQIKNKWKKNSKILWKLLIQYKPRNDMRYAGQLHEKWMWIWEVVQTCYSFLCH